MVTHVRKALKVNITTSSTMYNSESEYDDISIVRLVIE